MGRETGARRAKTGGPVCKCPQRRFQTPWPAYGPDWIHMEIRLGDWRVVPMVGEHCWQLQRRSDKNKRGWTNGVTYPCTLHDAVAALFERAAKSAGGTFDIGGGSADAILREIDGMVSESIRRIESAAGNAV